MVSPSLAFFITDDPTKVEAGTATAQSGSFSSNSAVNGTFAFAMDGFNTRWDAGRFTIASGTCTGTGPGTWDSRNFST